MGKFFTKTAGNERYFIGVDLPKNIKSKIPSSSPDSLHMTLSYLGKKDSSEIPDMIKALHEAAKDSREFNAHAPFYASFRDKIPYAGVERSSPLLDLKANIDNNLPIQSIMNKDFIPHISLGKDQILPETNLDVTFPINKINLYQSDISHPREYKTLATAELKKRNLWNKFTDLIQGY